jgi:hypothetical protein
MNIYFNILIRKFELYLLIKMFKFNSNYILQHERNLYFCYVSNNKKKICMQ